MPQPKRTETLERFRNDEIRLLVASDVAARGLDIKGMSHVFCFDVPIHAEDYIHRIGRTGRAGLEGRSFMLATPEDGDAVAAITKLIGKEIPPVTIDGFVPAELEYGKRGKHRARQPAQSRPSARSRAGRAQPRSEEDQLAHRNGEPRRGKAPRQNGHDTAGSNVTLFPPPARLRRPAAVQRKPEQDRPVVGFGDHLPAFLARPPRIVAGR
jgi:superfamily II DNA/RNA helicase